MEFPQRTTNIMKNPSYYKVLAEEGRGAYSVVNHVVDPQTRKSYALKQVILANISKSKKMLFVFR